MIEQHDDIAWQRGMLLPWAQSQVSFLKDLVTMRNPRSRFSFINYLYETQRLHDFINMSSFLPFRLEISAYLQWVARSLSLVEVRYGRRCMRVDAVRSPDGEITRWLVELSDGSVINARNLVVGIGRDPHIPEVFSQPGQGESHPQRRVRRPGRPCSTTPRRCGSRWSGRRRARRRCSGRPTSGCRPAQCTMIMRTVGLGYYQTSQFTNELYFPSYTDTFYAAPPEARQRVLQEMRRTNYAGVTPELLNTIYRQMYLERLIGQQRLRMIPSVDITDGPDGGRRGGAHADPAHDRPAAPSCGATW